MTKPGCKAYQVSDQMSCPHCGLVWDMNDPEPPECRLITVQPGELKGMEMTKVWIEESGQIGKTAIKSIRALLK